MKTDFRKPVQKFTEQLSALVEDSDDLRKIKMKITEFINEAQDKKILLNSIEMDNYNFDKILLEKIKKYDKDKLIKELIRISKKIIITGDINKLKDIEFPNMFVSCRYATNEMNKHSYCKNKKLILPKDKFKELIDILASDILNPMKQKYLFSSIFTDNTIEYFKFIRRPHEKILIMIEQF